MQSFFSAQLLSSSSSPYRDPCHVPRFDLSERCPLTLGIGVLVNSTGSSSRWRLWTQTTERCSVTRLVSAALCPAQSTKQFLQPSARPEVQVFQTGVWLWNFLCNILHKKDGELLQRIKEFEHISDHFHNALQLVQIINLPKWKLFEQFKQLGKSENEMWIPTQKC